MGVQTAGNIKRLVLSRYANGLMFSQWLKEEGYSRQLLSKYKASGWLESLSRGVMTIKGNDRNALVALACYNEQLGKRYRVAAHSALELEGFNHYVPMGKPTLMVAHGNDKAPSWLKTNIFDHNYILFSTDVFQYVPTSNIPIEKYNLLASSPELAFMECLLLSSKRYSLMDLYYIMEQLTSLRPKIVQELLEHTTSYKVKRLFLYMAEKANHYWYDMLDTSKIDIGNSKVQLVKNGTYVAKYKMTVPKELYDYDVPKRDDHRPDTRATWHQVKVNYVSFSEDGRQ